ncbi:hypothetical protein [Streptomyces sp. 891-h]|uniref:hypothetical protein n=1 Tax=Streptomyces sp. 891-h TaxID=2720714 RepID=UPI001FAA78CB|nr:hypothetical protein [Streptomyces sp. 891-h]UNZ17076.1 hypothetical protein HC362_08330 [Streptomyces sp. 891-h]
MSLTPSPAAARPRRRSILTGALSATSAAFGLPLVSACTDQEGPESADGESADAARRLRGSAARDSEHLLARYDGTIKVHPALAAPLRPLREEVARHVRVLRGRESGTTEPSPGPSGSPGTRSPSGGSPRPTRSGRPDGRNSPSERPPSPDTASVPKSEKAAFAALAEAERRLADARTRALESAPPEFARLLASVAACGAAHRYLLDEHGKKASGDSGGADEGAADR